MPAPITRTSTCSSAMRGDLPSFGPRRSAVCATSQFCRAYSQARGWGESGSPGGSARPQSMTWQTAATSHRMPPKKTVKPRDQTIDPRLVKVLAHPLRVRILGILEQRVASPSEISGELDASLGVVSYHVRRLEALGLIKLVRKTPRRGAVEHYYQADPKRHIPDEAWSQSPDIVRRAMAGATLGELSARVNAAASSGGFSRDDAHISVSNLALDEQGWKAVSRELARTLERVDRIQADAAARVRKRGGEAERDTTVSMMLFEAAEVPADGNTAKKPRRTRARSKSRA